MPSYDNFKLVDQISVVLDTARKGIIDTATFQKARLDANEWTAAYVRAQVATSGANYVAQLQRIANKQAECEAALTDWNVSVPAMTAEYTLLRDAAIAMRDCTVGNVAATLTQIIAQVTPKTRLF